LPQKNLLMGKKQDVFNDVGVNASYSGSLLWKNHVFLGYPLFKWILRLTNFIMKKMRWSFIDK
jgi:hypothetical protein